MKKLLALASFVLLASFAPPSLAEADSNLVERAVELLEKISVVVDVDKDNCDKMGTDIGYIADQNAALLAALRAHKEKLTPAQKAELEKKYGARIRAALHRMQPGLAACYKNDKVKAAFSKLQDLSG